MIEEQKSTQINKTAVKVNKPGLMQELSVIGNRMQLIFNYQLNYLTTIYRCIAY